MIPSWFETVCQNPDGVVTKFKSFFSKHSDTNYLDDLSSMFGVINFEQTLTLLPSQLKNKAILRKRELDKRFLLIWSNFASSFRQKLPLDPILKQKTGLLTMSALKGYDNSDTLLLEEMKCYFLSRPMPVQESKAFNCYEITQIKDCIDTYAKDLKNVVSLLFSNSTEPFSLQEQCILFKSASIKFQNEQSSWGELIHYWGESSRLSLSKLLITEGKKIRWLPQQKADRSFKQFVIESTLNMLFKSENAPLPNIKKVWKDLEEVFYSANSEEVRENVVYYIDSLQKKLPFDTALEILHALLTDYKSFSYHFLHAITHYFYALKTLNVEDEFCKSLLFEAIYSLPIEQRKIFDKAIEEKHALPCAFKLDSHSASLIRTNIMPLERWGELFLRFSRTKHNSVISASCLDLKGHLLLLEKLEEFMGFSLPEAVIEDLLFFQTAKKEVMEVIKDYENLREVICEKFIEEVPVNLSQELNKLSQRLISHWTAPSLVFPENSSYKQRNDQFRLVIENLIRMLETLVYPRPFVLIKGLIPEKIERTDEKDYQLTLSNEGINRIERLHLFEPAYTAGPLWISRWNLEEDGLYLTVSVVNSLQSLRTCTFSLKVPSQIYESITSFKRFLDGESFVFLSQEGNVFARSFHALFLKSTLKALLDSNTPRIMTFFGISTLRSTKKGFQSHSPALEIKYADYAPFLEKVYLSWKSSFDNECFETLQTLELHVKTENYFDDDTPWELVQVTWTLTLNEKDYASTVKYPPFNDNDTFIRLLVWQLALLKQSALGR